MILWGSDQVFETPRNSNFGGAGLWNAKHFDMQMLRFHLARSFSLALVMWLNRHLILRRDNADGPLKNTAEGKQTSRYQQTLHAYFSAAKTVLTAVQRKAGQHE